MIKIATILSSFACGKLNDNREKYKDWSDIMDKYGYAWQPYEV